MNLQHRTARGLVLVTVVLMAAALAGCIGDDGADAPAETDDQDEELEATNATDTEDEASAEAKEPTVEERSIPLEGSGTGQGFEPMEGSCYNCAWVVAEGYQADLTIPESYEEGAIEFAWEGGQSLGGMWLWIRDADQSTVHVFHVSESPFEVELDADDPRLDGAEEVVILPADTPTAVHVDVAWEGAFTFQALVDGGADDAEAET